MQAFCGAVISRAGTVWKSSVDSSAQVGYNPHFDALAAGWIYDAIGPEYPQADCRPRDAIRPG
jgi:hypothetical protein